MEPKLHLRNDTRRERPDRFDAKRRRVWEQLDKEERANAARLADDLRADLENDNGLLPFGALSDTRQRVLYALAAARRPQSVGELTYMLLNNYWCNVDLYTVRARVANLVNAEQARAADPPRNRPRELISVEEQGRPYGPQDVAAMQGGEDRQRELPTAPVSRFAITSAGWDELREWTDRWNVQQRGVNAARAALANYKRDSAAAEQGGPREVRA